MPRSRVLPAAACAVGSLALVVAMCLWLRVPPLPPDGVSAAAPLGPGYALVVQVWTYELAFSPQYTSGGLTRQTPGPLRLSIGYTRAPFGVEERLAVLTMSAWPPALLGGILLSLGASGWRQMVRSERVSAATRPGHGGS
jgi:hypothetical protein